MTVNDIIVEFDLLYNNISSNKAPGLNLLEKSVYLTDAKEDVIKDLYSGNSGPYEITEEVAEYLQSITKETNPTLTIAETKSTANLPEDCWFIVYETAKFNGDDCADWEALVVPTKHDELYKALDNPFRKPDKHKVLRTLSNNKIELRSEKALADGGYTMRYISRPGKVYLGNFRSDSTNPEESNVPPDWYFPDSSTWNTYEKNPLQMPESLHRYIVLRAVQLAKNAWNS